MIWFIGDTRPTTTPPARSPTSTPTCRWARRSPASTGPANATTAVEYQFHGLASNTIAAVDQGGTVNASFSYAPFGEVVEATNAGGTTAGTAAHRRRLNDKYVDELSDLAYYGVRYYDKTLLGLDPRRPTLSICTRLRVDGT